MKKLVLIIYLFTLPNYIISQNFSENKKAKIISWSLLQLVPSPTLYQDSYGKNARVQFGLKWHIIPLNISFNPNKFVSPFQFLYINPVRRFTGSAEVFIQPELATAPFRYAGLSVFGISAGPRIIIPVFELGENLCFSLAGKYTYRKNFENNRNYYTGIEAGLYVFGGMLGLQYTQNFNTSTKFNISFYIKYF
jgi:hypothetical protein